MSRYHDGHPWPFDDEPSIDVCQDFGHRGSRDSWEVIKQWGDYRRPEISTHQSIELAEKAYAAAVAKGFYAVDVLFLPRGNPLMFESLFGIENGFFWVYYHGIIYSDKFLNPSWKEN